VTGGTFYRTYTNNGTGATGTADPASVSTFRLDEYEVTVGRFRQFARAVVPADGGAGWRPPAGSGKHSHLNGGQGLENSASPGTYEPGWVAADDGNLMLTTTFLVCNARFATWTDSPGSNEELPINCVNWWEAYAFCIWDGGFLPSEAEWEYAAAGGSQQREYPWGSAAPGTACPGTGCEYAIYDCEYPSGAGAGSCTGVANIAPVGTATLGAGVWGQLDLAGNVWEWALDQYAAYVDPCADCAFLATNADRVFRGGNFYGPASDQLPNIRSKGPPGNRDDFFGLRCARAP
jgi:formylglycine-generating enzyme required for sulfatase activity